MKEKVQLRLCLEFTDIVRSWSCTSLIIPSPKSRTVIRCPSYYVHHHDAVQSIDIWLICIPICVGNIDAAHRDKVITVIAVHTNPCFFNIATFQYLINFLVDVRVVWYGQVATTCTTIILSLRPNARFITKIVAAITDMKPVTRT